MWHSTVSTLDAPLLLAQEVAPAGSTTATFTHGIAAILFILAAFGLYAVTQLASTIRTIVLIILTGILFVNIPALVSLGRGVREFITGIAVNQGFPEVAADVTFGAVVLLLIVIAASALNSNKKSKGWLITIILLTLAFFTITGAQEVIVTISHAAAKALASLQGVDL